MKKLGFARPLKFLATPQQNELNILDLNYDCILEIYSYLSAHEDKLSLAKAHPRFREVFARTASRLYAKVNIRMLSIDIWTSLLQLFGDVVVEVELCHGPWDVAITQSFLLLLNAHCNNLRHLHLIFAKTDPMPPAEINILQILQPKNQNLQSLSLIDASAADVLQIQFFVQLEALHIDGIDVDITDSDFIQMFQALPVLRRLSLHFLTRRQLPPISGHCPQLEHLSLENFEHALMDVGDFPKLRSLCLLWNGSELCLNLFQSLAERYGEQLEQLQLTRVEPEHVVHIVALKSLKALACEMWPNEALMRLSQLQQLECLLLQLNGPTANLAAVQLIHMVSNCRKLQHLKLTRRWRQKEFVDFVCIVQKELCKQVANNVRAKLLLTLDLESKIENISKETQNQLKQKWRPQRVQLDLIGVACPLCVPHRHTKPSIPKLLWY